MTIAENKACEKYDNYDVISNRVSDSNVYDVVVKDKTTGETTSEFSVISINPADFMVDSNKA